MTRFMLREEPPFRLALDLLIPERLAGLSPAEIERLPLWSGNTRESLGDRFRIAPGDPGTVEIEGPGRRLDRIGAGMAAGAVIVGGDAGAYLGLGMRGGSVRVEGSAGYGAASQMLGGIIHVRGDAGDGLAGGLPGDMSGMRGGLVRVDGRAGARAAHRLRRGLIVIGGDAGPGCGHEMIAGTVLVGGALGRHAGVAMRRGSLLALGGAASLAPSFADSGAQDLLILALLGRHLAAQGLPQWSPRLGPMRRFVGDQAAGGKGEILVPA